MSVCSHVIVLLLVLLRLGDRYDTSCNKKTARLGGFLDASSIFSVVVLELLLRLAFQRLVLELPKQHPG